MQAFGGDAVRWKLPRTDLRVKLQCIDRVAAARRSHTHSGGERGVQYKTHLLSSLYVLRTYFFLSGPRPPVKALRAA